MSALRSSLLSGAALAVLVFSTPVHALVSCPPGRYLIDGAKPQTPGGSTIAEALIVEDAGISLAPTCANRVFSRTRPGRRFERVRAGFSACSNTVGLVAVRGRINADCSLMRGVLSTPAHHGAFAFRAPLSICGDGRVDTGNGEQCDGANDALCSGLCLGDCHCAMPIGVVEADASVFSSDPDGKHGSSVYLNVDADVNKTTYFRLRVENLGRRVAQQAILRLQVADIVGADSDQGGTLHQTSDCSWDEKKVTWNTRPTYDPAAIVTVGKVAQNQVVDFDLTSAIAGDGTYCFALDSSSTNGVKYNAHEAAAGQPQLVITLAQ